MKKTSRGCLSGSTLKIIAICCMFIDHLAASVLYYGILLRSTPAPGWLPAWNWYVIYRVMRTIGRVAFPIFCFLLVEGFFHTSNRRKYALRLFLFCLLSEFPFDLALFNSMMDWNYQNVFFTLLIGFLTIWCMETIKHSDLPGPALPVLQLLAAFAGCGLAWLLRTDYDYKGILLILIFYLFYQKRVWMTVLGILGLLWEAPAILAFLPINLYNGKRGISLKYFFYLFYPLHLLLFAGILHWLF